MFDLSPSVEPPVTCASTSLQQSPLWLSATHAQGAEAKMAYVGGAKAMILCRTLPLVGQLSLISRANLRLSPDTADTLRHDLDTSHLVINAETLTDAKALAVAGFHRIFAPRVIAELPLLPSTVAMAARLTPKWRNRLRRGQAQGLVIRRRVMPPDARHWLFRAEARQSLRKWYQPLPATFVAAMAAAKPGAAQVFTAYHLGQRIAAMLFLRHGRTATYQIGWSNEAGKNLSAGPALMWRAMVELQSMGIDLIDLGAADKRLAPGLAHFKLGTGATRRSLGGAWLDTSWGPRSRQKIRRRMTTELDVEEARLTGTDARPTPQPRATIGHARAARPEFPTR